MKTYLKTLTRMFKKHVTRFISIIFIVLISVGFISGIGTSGDKIEYSLTEYYKHRNVGDFIIKTENENGFTAEDTDKIRTLYGSENVNTGMSLDVKLNICGGERLTRLYFLDEYMSETVNVRESLERLSSDGGSDFISASAEMPDNKIKNIPLGTEIELDFKNILTQLSDGELDDKLSMLFDNAGLLGFEYKKTVKVCETVKSPLTFAQDGEPSYLNPEDTEIPDTINAVNELITLDAILYLPSSAIPEIPDNPVFGIEGRKLLSSGDMYVAIADRSHFKAFDKRYKDFIDEQRQAILSALGESAEGVRFISLYDNYSFVSLISYADKVTGIGIVLMVAFLFVTALVVLSNMTRLMEEERAQIACLKTLGYSSFKIIFKYVLFAMIATGIGGGGSYFVGLGLAYLICYVFNYSFSMMPISSHVAVVFFVIVFSVIVLVTLAATLIAGIKLTNEKPANLLRPKPPKAGRKVFLEKIPFIWNKLSFKYKSTTRNVLRYLSRFIMTVVSVAVSTALVLAGLALLDVCLFGGLDSPSVMAIAVVVIAFAGLLTAVVIYTLTNINISERNRELATLKVLGYQDKEVAGYIYREIYIDSAVGILFGYPLSVLIMQFLFWIMGMGSVSGVTWFWWLAAPFIVLMFTFIVTLMLKRKIVRIDMNESLKAIE